VVALGPRTEARKLPLRRDRGGGWSKFRKQRKGKAQKKNPQHELAARGPNPTQGGLKKMKTSKEKGNPMTICK